MSKTEVSGKQIKDGSIEQVDLSSALSTDINTLKSDVATLQTDVAGKASAASLATVATSGSYDDLTNKPTIPSLTAVEGDVAALDARVTVVEADVASLQGASAPNLSDLGEVSITTPSSGEVLKYNGTGWANAADSTFSGDYNDLSNKPSLFSGSYSDLTNKPSVPSALDDLSDVTISSPSTDQVLKYDGSAWVNAAAPAGGASNLDGLSDVVITSAAMGHFIAHNGTNFVNTRTIQADSASTKPLIVKGAASQTANLFEVQNSSGNALTVIDNAGNITMGPVTAASTAINILSPAGYQSNINFRGNGNTLANSLYVGQNSTSTGYVWQNGNYAVVLGTNNTERFRVAADGTVAIGSNAPAAQFHVQCGAAATKGLIVRAAGSQSANLIEAQNSSSTSIFSVGPNGASAHTTTAAAEIPLTITRPASPTNYGFVVRNSAGKRLVGIGADPATGELAGYGGYLELGSDLYTRSVLGYHTSTGAVDVVANSNYVMRWNYTDGGSGGYWLTLYRNTASTCWNFEVSGFASAVNFATNLGVNLSATATAQFQVNTSSASKKAMIIKAAASQTANVFEVQASNGGAYLYVNNNHTVFMQATAATEKTLIVRSASNGDNAGHAHALDIQNGWGNTVAYVKPTGSAYFSTTLASVVPLTAKGAASQTANLFEVQNSASVALVTVSSAGTLHAARYTETVANAFNTSLAPSTGTLTVDTSLGNAVLGALSDAVTTWAFTNVPADNSKVTTVTAVIAGNASYTYGDACSVNGSAVSGGIMWSGGSAPTATAGTDIITFIIVKDSAGTVKVFGSATTNFS